MFFGSPIVFSIFVTSRQNSPEWVGFAATVAAKTALWSQSIQGALDRRIQLFQRGREERGGRI